MSNIVIRRAIRKYKKHYGMQDTRKVITLFSNAYKTSRQRISGNLSYMACVEHSIQIISNRPHSIMC